MMSGHASKISYNLGPDNTVRVFQIMFNYPFAPNSSVTLTPDHWHHESLLANNGSALLFKFYYSPHFIQAPLTARFTTSCLFGDKTCTPR